MAPRQQFELLTPDENASPTPSTSTSSSTRFCPTCGMPPNGEGVDPKGNSMAAINIRCLEDVTLEKVAVTTFDGRSR